MYRVAVHEREAAGLWRVRPFFFATQDEAEQYAAQAVRDGGCSNAGVYPEVDGRLPLPPWMRLRDEGGAVAH